MGSDPIIWTVFAAVRFHETGHPVTLPYRCKIRAMAARHHEVTRLEGFSDAAFASSLTPPVVSLEVPGRAEALSCRIPGWPGLAWIFAMVCWICLFFSKIGPLDRGSAFLPVVGRQCARAKERVVGA